MSEVVGSISQLSTIPDNATGRWHPSDGHPPNGLKLDTPVNNLWRLKGLLIATGQWVPIEVYANEVTAKEALLAVRARSTFSDRAHIRDHEAFAVYAIELTVSVSYHGGVLRG